MLIRPHTLSLITTHQCTAACDHCCFHCSPKVTKAIPIPRLFSLIDEAREIPSLRVVVFTGGECFLLRHDLDALIGRATANGYRTRCVTNGYWATSLGTAAARIESAAKAGLKEINLSTGSFHAAYVPVERILNACTAAIEANITTLVNIEIFQGSNFDANRILEDEKIRTYLEKGRIIIQRNVWIGNRGKFPILNDARQSRFNEENISGCKTALGVIAVTPDQNLMACCGLHMEKIEELKIGSVAEKTLREAIESEPDDFLKIWIHVAGPERILQFVKRFTPEFPLPLSSPHPCETCLHLYESPIALSTLKKHYKEIETEITTLYLAGLARQEISSKVNGLAVCTADI